MSPDGSLPGVSFITAEQMGEVDRAMVEGYDIFAVDAIVQLW